MVSKFAPGRAVSAGALCLAACFGAAGAHAQTGGKRAAGNANQAPVLSAHFAGNRTFLWPDVPLEYLVIASDKEDGDTLSGGIDPERVAVAFEYAADGKPSGPVKPVSAQQVKAQSAGRRLVAANGCARCHAVSGRRPIPSYAAIGERHGDSAEAAVKLAAKIISGGSGVWGETKMPPHSQVSTADALVMARYVLSLAKAEARRIRLPIRGSIAASGQAVPGPFGSLGAGRFLLLASYTDRGGAGAPRTGQLVVSFRAPVLLASERTAGRNLQDFDDGPTLRFAAPTASTAILNFDGIDLTEVRSLGLIVGNARDAWAGGGIEVRLDAPTGTIIGRASVAPDGGPSSVARIPVDIAPTRGVRPLYIVLRGDKGNKRGSVAVAALRFER